MKQYGILLAATAALPTLAPRQMWNCPSTPTCPRWNGCVATATNGAVFQFSCATDFNGPVIDVAQANLFVDCGDACARRSGCVTFNMKDNFCYLLGKPVGTARISNNNVNAGVQIKNPAGPELTPGSSTCTTVIDCPNDDKCKYLTNSNTFIARCNYDYYGGDIAIKRTESMTKCVDECAVFPGCVAVTWVDTMCWLKNTNYKIVYNSAVDSAVLEV